MTVEDRVAITGMGAVSALGIGIAPMREALLAGRSGIRPLVEDLPPGFVARHAGRALEFRPLPDTKDLPRHVQMAVAAASEALADSGLNPTDRPVGLVFSTCIGPLSALEARPVADEPTATVSGPLESGPALAMHGGAILLARRLGIRGPVTTVTTACTASAGAIGRATDLLRAGHVDAVLVGGADAFSLATLAGFDRLRTTSAMPCAPFSQPAGMTLGEGAGFWVLEPESIARSRRSPMHGFVLGHGLSNDACHPTAPDPTGAGIRRCITAAVADARVRTGDLGYVSAHGSGTRANDRIEARAVARAFDDTPPPTGSSKSALGHALGAAGILEATASLLAIGHGMLPPTLHFTVPREGCVLDCVPNAPRPTRTSRFLSQNLAFHGHNAAIVLATPTDPPTGPRPDPAPVVIVARGIALASPEGMDGATQGPTLPRGIDHATELAARATRRALAAAGVPDRADDRARVGLVLAQGPTPTAAQRRFLERWHRAGPSAPDLVSFSHAVPNAVAGTVARLLGLKAWSTVVSAGHDAGLDALACAADAAALGHADRIVTGTARERPVDAPPGKARDGAAVLVLERARAAIDRGAAVLARLASWRGAFLDPVREEDVATLIAVTLANARVAPAAVGACRLASETPDVPLLSVAERLLPHAAFENARRGDPPASLADGMDLLFDLATLLGGGPVRAPILAASLSRHGEARVLVLVPPSAPDAQESAHA